MPLEDSSFVLKLEARSIGTRSMMLTGSASARKIGIRRYAEVVRRGRKWRRRKSTLMEMTKTDEKAKRSEPREDFIMISPAAYSSSS